MSDKILKRLWAVCLMAGGVCAVVIGILNIMGVKPAKEEMTVFLRFPLAVLRRG